MVTMRPKLRARKEPPKVEPVQRAKFEGVFRTQ
jgi:hypothetical protein